MRNCLVAMTMMVAALASSSSGMPVDPTLPRYEARAVALPKNARYVTRIGDIAVVGYNDMREMLAALGARFTAMHPGFRFAWDLPGTKAAPAALAAGTSAFAPMGATFTPTQLRDYEKLTHMPPLAIRVAHASLSPHALSGPLAIFVHRDSPLASLTVAELAAIFSGADLTRGLRPCGVTTDAALGLFFRDRVLGGQPFAVQFAGLAQSADVVQRVGEDVKAIGFAAACRATPAVKMLALAARAGEAPVAVTDGNLMADRYPLDRHLLIYVRAPLEPWVAEFLRFVLSRDGQALIAAGTLGYLPLSAESAAAERAQVDRAGSANGSPP